MDFSTAFDSSTCLRKGLCPVTKIRHQDDSPLESHSLYFEIHGSSKQSQQPKHKILVIMGLNSSSFSWGPQVRHFPQTGRHEVLAFDNRGVGNSGYPKGPYSTSAMAEDVVALLEYVGWTEERSVNVVGVSLGGMIAQELATRIPTRIRSLVLAVTTPGGGVLSNFLIPWKGLSCLARLTFTPDPIQKVPLVMDMLFPSSWLDEQAEGDDKRRTNRQVQSEAFLQRAAITKPQQLLGALSQMCAGLTHHVSPARLAGIADSVPRVYIVTGDEDHLIRPVNSVRIRDGMVAGRNDGRKNVEYVAMERTGHAIHVQREREFNALVERACEEGLRAVAGM